MGQAVWEISFEPQDSGISALFHEEHGTIFFKDGTLQEILGYVGTRLTDWSLNSGLHGL